MSKVFREKIIITEEEDKPLTIKGKDFFIEQIDEEAPMYDLYLNKIVNKGKSNQRTELDIDSYGIPIELVLYKIYSYRKRNKVFLSQRIYDEIKTTLWKPRLKLRML